MEEWHSAEEEEEPSKDTRIEVTFFGIALAGATLPSGPILPAPLPRNRKLPPTCDPRRKEQSWEKGNRRRHEGVCVSSPHPLQPSTRLCLCLPVPVPVAVDWKARPCPVQSPCTPTIILDERVQREKPRPSHPVSTRPPASNTRGSATLILVLPFPPTPCPTLEKKKKAKDESGGKAFLGRRASSIRPREQQDVFFSPPRRRRAFSQIPRGPAH